MFSSALWKKRAQASFSRAIKIAQIRRKIGIWRLWKYHECILFQIARETMLLPINNVHEKARNGNSLQITVILHSVTLKLDCSQLFRIEKFFHANCWTSDRFLVARISSSSKWSRNQHVTEHLLILNPNLSTLKRVANHCKVMQFGGQPTWILFWPRF